MKTLSNHCHYEEVLDDTANQFNRSCHVVRLNDSSDLTELNNEMKHIQKKLGSAEAEIENMLSENISCKKIAEQEN